jgi:hypothetical protein
MRDDLKRNRGEREWRGDMIHARPAILGNPYGVIRLSQKHTPDRPDRACRCGTILSRYNPGVECFKCEDTTP